jgi:putative SOS response-associated peptidase YedK
MCGRFTLHTTGALVAQQFELPNTPDLQPRYNIAPTQDVAVVRQEAGVRALVALRWGVVPSWSKEPSIGVRMINARGETVAEKPAFRAAFKYRRCLVLADGFYEWQAAGKGHQKQPYYVQRQDKAPFAFAGLWERWSDQNGDGSVLETCTIITTAPNELMRPIHERMPVILLPEDYALWLDSSMQEPGPLEALLHPYPTDLLTAYPVSRAVNNARHDSPECLEPAAA